ncbi:unnamed protein product [Ilex paraguariensis]|uniref:Uncharacterized protein n=1 Tax=Ilex paraguariensis TaxID=185542 RepID=A0ABC8RY02_9AQUA
MAMAIELCSENCGLITSPRISFSHDLSQTDIAPVQYLNGSHSSSSSVDFDFCIYDERFDQESSSADEIFSNGKILPFEITKKIAPPRQVKPPQAAHVNNVIDISVKSLRSEKSNGMKMASSGSDDKQNSKSFWCIKRSSSLNCGNGYARILCPLPLLSRSSSTDSPPTVKRLSSTSKESWNNKQHSKKILSVASMKQKQSSSSTSYQKSPLKKGYGV